MSLHTSKSVMARKIARVSTIRGGGAQTTRAFPNLFGGRTSKKSTAKDDVMNKLLVSIDQTSRGTNQTKAERAEILGYLEELEALSSKDPIVNESLLSGTWRLIWTTEKEILGIIKQGGVANWFGTAAGDVLQVIDLPNDRLQNCIEFPPAGAFLVDSFIQFDDEDQKCSFKFSGAALKTSKRVFKVPPMGKSRFQTLYVSKTHRVAFDDRGDYLIVERVGPPRDLFREYDIPL